MPPKAYLPLLMAIKFVSLTLFEKIESHVLFKTNMSACQATRNQKISGSIWVNLASLRKAPQPRVARRGSAVRGNIFISYLHLIGATDLFCKHLMITESH